MQALPKDIGWVEVICGPMFSGKTEELIRRLRRALYARQTVRVFKPKIDTRYAEVEIVSHSHQRLEAEPIEDPREILTQQKNVEVIGIDEAQFFDTHLLEVTEALAKQGKRVIVAGLDQDYRGAPFGSVPALLASAEFVTKTLAICVVCGNPAGRSQRLVQAQSQVLLGAHENYEARCRRCHVSEGVTRPLPLELAV
jgi:thymidine kinase